MKKLFLILFAIMLTVTVSAFAVSAEEADDAAVETSAETSVEAKDDAAEDDMGVDLDFNPAGFGRNLKYMGLGMLGIFVVVGVVILITFILNSVTGKKKN